MKKFDITIELQENVDERMTKVLEKDLDDLLYKECGFPSGSFNISVKANDELECGECGAKFELRDKPVDYRQTNEICCRCRWWHRTEELDYIGCGECRYGPPTAIAIAFQKPPYGHFPVISEYEWCGRWEAKDPVHEP